MCNPNLKPFANAKSSLRSYFKTDPSLSASKRHDFGLITFIASVSTQASSRHAARTGAAHSPGMS